jgi:M-phase inducer phosphatase 2
MGEDISFYSTNSPAASPRQLCLESSPCHNDQPGMGCLSAETSPRNFTIDKIAMSSISHDSTSMDSGYGNSSISNSAAFLKPKHSASSPSNHRTPLKFSLTANGSGRMGNGFKAFNSLSTDSIESGDDDFMDLMDMENLDDDTQMPNDLTSLICKDIKNAKTPDNKRPTSFVRKCLNMDGPSSGAKNILFSSPLTPKSSTIASLITTPNRQCLASIDNVTPLKSSSGGFKRPEPPTISPVQSKRHKCENEPTVPSVLLQLQKTQKRPVLRKSVSMNDAVIMSALSRSSSEPNLIGDFSRPFCLPLIEGRHTDLKSITAETLKQLLNGEFDSKVGSYKIIDCRFPYEYNGGHIRGALNMYTQEQVLEELVSAKTESPAVVNGEEKRNILIFHCEFSSERGPKL